MAHAVPASVTQTPSAQDLSELTRYVLDYVQGVSDPEQEQAVKRGLNRAIDRINSRNWKWNYTSQTITLSATDSYSLNANVHKPLVLQRLNSSSERDGRIRWLEPSVFFRERDDGTESGTPSYYTLTSPHNDGNLVLNVVPDAAFRTNYPTLKFWYCKRIAHFAQPSNVLDAPPEYGNFVGWHGRWEYAAVKGESRLARDAKIEAESIWRLLVADDNDTMTDWDDS